MNRQRRTEVRKAINLFLEAKDILENVLSEEQEAFDNLPDSLQASTKGAELEDNICILENVIDFLEGADIEDLEELLG